MARGLHDRLMNTRRVDWFAVLVDLNRKGLHTAGIADLIRAPRTTVLGWKQGGEPCHADGEALVQLWCRVMERERADLPLIALAEAMRAGFR
jgi:hypothetical protein